MNRFLLIILVQIGVKRSLFFAPVHALLQFLYDSLIEKRQENSNVLGGDRAPETESALSGSLIRRTAPYID